MQTDQPSNTEEPEEKKRFIIETMTGITLEEWHKNNEVLQKLVKKVNK